MKDLLQELKEVADQWFDLGISLKISHSKLKELEEDCDDIEERKTEMILVWRQLYVPTWSMMVNALAEIEMRTLALKIAEKYGKSL